MVFPNGLFCDNLMGDLLTIVLFLSEEDMFIFDFGVADMYCLTTV